MINRKTEFAQVVLRSGIVVHACRIIPTRLRIRNDNNKNLIFFCLENKFLSIPIFVTHDIYIYI